MRSIPRIAILATAALLAGCGGASEAAQESGSASEPTEEAGGVSDPIALNIGTLRIAALSNLYAAEELGYFDDQGLDVTFTEMGGGAELLPAVSAGQIDLTLSIPSSAIQARSGGFDFKMIMQNEVAATEGVDSQALFVQADSDIAEVSDLVGKRVAVNNINSQMWLSVVEVLESEGIDFEQVEFVETPFPNMRDALANDQVDAAFNVEPFTSNMATSGEFEVLSYAATQALPGQPIGAFWTTGDWYDQNQEAADKFVAAMRETNAYLAENEDEKNELIAEYTAIDLAVIEAMTPIRWDSDVNEDTLQALLDLMQEHSLLEEPITAEDVLLPTAIS